MPGLAVLQQDLPTWLETSGLLGAVAFGLLSAFIPPLNAEVYALAVPVLFPHSWVAQVLAMTAGFMVGKTSHLLAARRGADVISRRRERRLSDRVSSETPRSPFARLRRRVARLSARAVDTLDQPVLGPLVVALSAFSGLPPFALVTVAAGVRRVNIAMFVVVGSLGCLARFMLTAWLVSSATS